MKPVRLALGLASLMACVSAHPVQHAPDDVLANVPCPAWRPDTRNWSSLPTSSPPNLSSPRANHPPLRSSPGAAYVYSVGSWMEDGAVRNQIVRSADLGTTWCLLASPGQVVEVIPSPTAASQLYAVIGGAQSIGPRRWALQRTTDGGATWEARAGGLAADANSAGEYLALSVTAEPDVLSLTGETGQYLSRDGGASWTVVAPPPLPTGDAFFSPAGGLVNVASPNQIVHWTKWNPVSPDGSVVPGEFLLHSSTDWGNTWTTRSLPTPAGTQIASLNLMVDSAFTLYASEASGVWGRIGTDDAPFGFNNVQNTLWRSADQGATWRAMTLPSGAYEVSRWNSRRAGELFAVSKSFAPQDQHWRSVDGGAIWSLLPAPGDALWISTIGDGNRLMAATPRGMTSTTDAGMTWRQAPLIVDPYTLVRSPVRPNPLWSIGTGGGVARSDDDGLTWRRTLDTAAPYLRFPILADGIDPDVAYVALDTGLQRTENGGQTWQTVDLPAGGQCAAACAAPRSCLYVNVRHGIARSDDHGRSWSAPTSADLPTVTATLDRPCLIVSPDDDLTVLVAAANASTIYETHDAGLHWAAHVLTFGATGFAAITRLAFLPKNVALVTSDSGWVARSEDGGATWSPSAQISSSAPLWWLDASVAHPSTVFARTELPDAPFYRSDDSGRTWVAGPPVGVVGDIVDDGAGGFLVAAAYGLVRFQ